MGVEFLLTSLIVAAMPGTGVLYTLAAGLPCPRRSCQYRRRGWLHTRHRCAHGGRDHGCCGAPAYERGHSEKVIARPRVLTWMRRVFAGSIVALGAKLAFTRQ